MYTLRFIPWALAVLLLGAFFAVGATGWPGEFVGAGGMFCEAFRDAWVKQPANTWSNLGFVAAGLWMTTHTAAGFGSPPSACNPFTRSRGMPVVYAALVVFLGPGSMAMHGSGHAWGGTVDVLAMLVYITFPFAWAVTRFVRSGERTFWSIYLPLTAALAIPHTFGVLPISGITVYTVLIPTLLALEVALHLRRPAGARRPGFMVGAAACFVLALVIWLLSHTGAPLCDPTSLVQGHAIWHLLCAAATVCLFLAYANERGDAS